MTSQPSILFELRKEFHFDALEKILYIGSLNLLKSNLEIKVAKAKDNGIDVSEQQKMIAVLIESVRWVEELYKRGQEFTLEYNEQESHIKDLHSLNEILYNKVESLEKELIKVKQQQSF